MSYLCFLNMEDYNAIEGAYCWYNNEELTYKSYGTLYNWYAVNTEKLCPIVWLVPSNSDFTTLISFLGSNEGDKMKSLTGWSYSNYAFPTNSSGFPAKPSGSRGFSDWPSDLVDSYNARWWSSTKFNSTNSYTWYTQYNNSLLNQANYNGKGYCLRCMKDK